MDRIDSANQPSPSQANDTPSIENPRGNALVEALLPVAGQIIQNVVTEFIQPQDTAPKPAPVATAVQPAIKIDPRVQNIVDIIIYTEPSQRLEKLKAAIAPLAATLAKDQLIALLNQSAFGVEETDEGVKGATFAHSPLYWAVKKAVAHGAKEVTQEARDVIDYLLSLGMSIDEKDASGKSVIFAAIGTASPALIELILEKGASLDVSFSKITKKDGTPVNLNPLSYALQLKERYPNEYNAVVKLITEKAQHYFTDLTEQAASKWTPAQRQYFLLAAGAAALVICSALGLKIDQVYYVVAGGCLAVLYGGATGVLMLVDYIKEQNASKEAQAEIVSQEKHYGVEKAAEIVKAQEEAQIATRAAAVVLTPAKAESKLAPENFKQGASTPNAIIDNRHKTNAELHPSIV